LACAELLLKPHAWQGALTSAATLSTFGDTGTAWELHLWAAAASCGLQRMHQARRIAKAAAAAAALRVCEKLRCRCIVPLPARETHLPQLQHLRNVRRPHSGN